MISGAPGANSVGLGLLAAVSWGGGDFAGGMGAKATGGSPVGALRVVIAAHGLSLLALAGLLEAAHAGWPAGSAIGWGLVAGVAGGLSVSAFYIALSRGAMGASAAVSGLLAAAIPAVVSLVFEGAPGMPRLAGFLCAAVAIWLIAAAPAAPGAPTIARSTMALAIFGGVGFGVYFVAMRFANPLGVLWPLALARSGSVVTCGVLLLCFRMVGTRERTAVSGAWLNRTALLWVAGVALLDTGGNLLYVAATRAGRLDVAAVLASLYPASTILLAAWLLRERPSRRQWMGMGVAALAVVLITL